MPRIFIKGIKGGVGTTTVAANLASMLKKSNLDVLVAELDCKNDLGLHFGLPWGENSGWSYAKNFNDVSECAFVDNEGIVFLPYGENSAPELSVSSLINDLSAYAVKKKAWLLFDCPANINLADLPLNKSDIILDLVNCDAICHSFMYKKLKLLSQVKSVWQHYFVVNKYNSSSVIEFDLYSLWQSTMPLITPFFINHDEVIKESTAYKNVAINCAPYSITKDDFETLAGWLVSKVSK
ncbi:cellulose synthase operon protein YhjQ [Pseudoalteromonas sp. MMG010]|uniref:cellulose biosynthesis protein BcsQ n=1 Tax=Pseudoalteromonas sp. MMG010 TaxID=2822685 RepID=UPI001B3A5E8F|nr:cellulose synthase operon protein YhjQ [Pseudoalteromonas sp. MMG010]